MGRGVVRELLQGEVTMTKIPVKTAALFLFWKSYFLRLKGVCRKA